MNEVTTPVESVEKDSTIEIESVNTNEIIEEPKTEDTETFLDPNLLDKVQTAAETLAGELDQLLGSFARGAKAHQVVMENYDYLTGEPRKESGGIIDSLRSLLFGAE